MSACEATSLPKGEQRLSIPSSRYHPPVRCQPYSSEKMFPIAITPSLSNMCRNDVTQGLMMPHYATIEPGLASYA